MCSAATRRCCAPSTASTSASSAARRWALVGESGCGKSTLARTLIRLFRPSGGRMLFDGADIAELSERELRPYRRRMQMIFQDPYASLNGRMTVRDLIAEPLEIAGVGDAASRVARVDELLRRVGLSPEHATRFATNFRRPAPAHRHRPRHRPQPRAGDLRRADLRPRRVDPGAGRQHARGFAKRARPHLPVHHPRSVDGAGTSPTASASCIWARSSSWRPATRSTAARRTPTPRRCSPRSPSPIPRRGATSRRWPGEIPSPIDIPSGCRFRTRCPFATELCGRVEPPLASVGEGHFAACHYADRVMSGELQPN